MTILKTKALIYWSKLNEAERKMFEVHGKLRKNDDDIFNLSESNMVKMKANIGDLVYLSDTQRWIGGLKSIHSVFGKPDTDDGIIYAMRASQIWTVR
ncbi:MAG: hypothetical protein A2W30_00500 [Ignavibacteria bacterium RBG_16_36_9]|nr:MAG: hypothetical protein A2W30_00500 [Ignavibacteria bacterium RBG_16_36_9]